jgi:hypothetical protein
VLAALGAIVGVFRVCSFVIHNREPYVPRDVLAFVFCLCRVTGEL